MAATLHVRVPATTANLGSGFDCVGIAFDILDDYRLEPRQDAAVRVTVEGEGADRVPLDETHLVVSSLREGLRHWGGSLRGFDLHCTNRIPHSRGLGSSAAAIVGGLSLAWGIAHPRAELDRYEVARVASLLEGHPDNAGAAALGGAVLGWIEGEQVTTVGLDLHRGFRALAWVPEFHVPTAGARHVLPDSVPRLDAVSQAVSAATLPIALHRRPDLLLAATADRLHQRYRAGLMAPSYALMESLRTAGVPAAISGAGPTVIAVGTDVELAGVDVVPAPGFELHHLAVGGGVELGASHAR